MFFECSRLIDGNQPRLSNGITVTDVDGDGAFELVVTGYATNNLILKWDGSRLVDIAGVDRQPCGGTHVANTAEIGAVVVTRIEKKSATTRRVVLGFA